MALRRRRRTALKRTLRRRGRRTHGVSVAMRGAYPTLPPFGIVGSRRGRRIGVGTKRRFRSSGVTATKRRRVVKDPGGYQQWNRSSGSKVLARLTQRKVNLANSEILDLIWKRVDRLDGGGQLFAGNFLSVQAGGPDEVYRPIYLVDLTSGITTGVTHFPVVQLRRILSGATPQYDFYAVNGRQPTGAFHQGWNRASAPGPIGTSPSLSGTSILKWAEIRADIWGAKEHPCEWTFTLCQLNEEVLPSGVGTSVTSRVAIDWWDQLSAKLIFSPSDRKVANGPDKNYLRVLDRRSYLLNPTSTTESDSDPHVRSIRLFYKMNRRCNFMWENRSPVALTDDVDPANNANYDPFVTVDQHATVEPKARVFMMITCKNWRNTVASYNDMTTANTGTFNLGVYTRWVI